MLPLVTISDYDRHGERINISLDKFLLEIQFILDIADLEILTEGQVEWLNILTL